MFPSPLLAELEICCSTHSLAFIIIIIIKINLNVFCYSSSPQVLLDLSPSLPTQLYALFQKTKI